MSSHYNNIKAIIHLFTQFSQDEDVTNSDQVLVLSTNRLVVADDQCTQYQFKAPFYPAAPVRISIT